MANNSVSSLYFFSSITIVSVDKCKLKRYQQKHKKSWCRMAGSVAHEQGMLMAFATGRGGAKVLHPAPERRINRGAGNSASPR